MLQVDTAKLVVTLDRVLASEAVVVRDLITAQNPAGADPARRRLPERVADVTGRPRRLA